MDFKGKAAAAALLCAVLQASAWGPAPGREQDGALVGFLESGRIKSLAAAADKASAPYSPRPESVAALQSLVDPVHVMVFFSARRPEDLKLAAAVCRAFEAAANTALTVEYVGVSEDLARPASLLRDNGVKSVPEIVIFLQGLEGGRITGRPRRPVEEEIAETIQYARWRLAEDMITDYDYFKFTFHEDLPLDCTKCHLPVRSVARPVRSY
ncbi:MAG: hypothetical protein FJY79_09670 [Candidatus Aminicenantes bacterium]|nr:hypothetical protein [Candidatus Aminicenantes bacterium]